LRKDERGGTEEKARLILRMGKKRERGRGKNPNWTERKRGESRSAGQGGLIEKKFQRKKGKKEPSGGN